MDFISNFENKEMVTKHVILIFACYGLYSFLKDIIKFKSKPTIKIKFESESESGNESESGSESGSDSDSIIIVPQNEEGNIEEIIPECKTIIKKKKK